MKGARRILSIDGGGIKGVLPAAFLATLEEAADKRIVNHFDLIVGTSTGGIIALGLGLGLPASEILDFYETEGHKIFAQNGPDSSLLRRTAGFFSRKTRSARWALLPKYSATALQTALEKAFGNKLLGDSQTRLVIPAFDPQRREIHVFKTAHHKRFMVDWRTRVVDVALATAAAPTYLPSHRLENGTSLLDGGIWANNPVGLAVVEAIGTLGWAPESLYVLSIGCSEAPTKLPKNAGILRIMLKMADVFLLGQSRGAIGMAKLLLGPDGDQRLFRLQHSAAEGEFGLDTVSQIPELKGIGAGMSRENLPRIAKVFLSSPCDPFYPFHCSDN